jgi:LPS export ABC transporter permease LptG
MMFLWRDRVGDQPIRLALPAWLTRRRVPGVALVERLRLVSLLDRYVTAAYLRYFLLSGAALIGIFYIAAFLDHADKVFKDAITWTMLGEYFWYATPQWLYYVLPLSVLLAALITIAMLTKNSELIVMKACGISLYRVALPIFLTAAVVGGLLFGLEETVLGPSTRRAEEIRHVIRGGSPEAFDVLDRRWLVGAEGEIYYYTWFDPRNRLLSGLSIYEFDEGMERITRRTYADLATYLPAGDDEENPQDVWRVERGWTRAFDEQDKVSSFASFASDERRIETPDVFGTEQPDPRFMGYSQLRAFTDTLRARGFDVLEQEVGLARKIAFPFVTLVMVLIAVPFAVTIGRSGAMGGIGVGIAVAITYWTVISVFAALGTGGVLAPVLAAWAPNLLFGAGAAYLLLTVRT